MIFMLNTYETLGIRQKIEINKRNVDNSLKLLCTISSKCQAKPKKFASNFFLRF